jgi:hypothetical protein
VAGEAYQLLHTISSRSSDVVSDACVNRAAARADIGQVCTCQAVSGGAPAHLCHIHVLPEEQHTLAISCHVLFL